MQFLLAFSLSRKALVPPKPDEQGFSVVISENKSHTESTNFAVPLVIRIEEGGYAALVWLLLLWCCYSSCRLTRMQAVNVRSRMLRFGSICGLQI